MEEPKIHICLQPEYVSKFQCDGAVCGSKCCKKWEVDIDGPTYQKYCTIEPRTERKKIVSRIKYKKQKGKFIVEMTQDGACPFLQSDGLCHIQKTQGEDWLSNTCAIYPRIMYTAGDLLLRALTMTCPVAANQALLSKEPMQFEQRFIPAEQYEEIVRRAAGRLSTRGATLLDVQYGAISILQNRALSIDQRLIVLGFFLDQAGDFVAEGEPEKIELLSAVYTADDFEKQVPDMLRAIMFQPIEYVKSMFDLIETLYGKNATFHGREQELMRRVVRAFDMEQKEMPLASLVEKYRKDFCPVQAEMLHDFGYIFENYLVNEFFVNHYPQVITGTFIQNYILFVMTYKLLEFMAVAMVMTEEPKPDENRLVELIAHMTSSVDHNIEFLKSVARDTLKRQKDVVTCMKNLLYAGEEYST